MGRYGKRETTCSCTRRSRRRRDRPSRPGRGSLTATDAFDVRGHGTVPSSTPPRAAARDGLVERELELSLSNLREAFRQHEATATLQCARQPARGPDGPIRDIRRGALARRHRHASGPGRARRRGSRSPSCCPRRRTSAPRPPTVRAEAEPAPALRRLDPLDKACRSEVLLALAMNGEPLPPVHGAPLRVVVPGYIGARSVKWLERIELRSTPWEGYFQHVVYRLLPEDESPGPGAGRHRPRRAQRRRAVARRWRDRRGRPGRGARVRVRGRRTARRARRPLARRWRKLVAGRAARGPRTLGVEALADAPSTSHPESTRSSSAPGTPPPRPSRRTRPRYGTRRAT